MGRGNCALKTKINYQKKTNLARNKWFFLNACSYEDRDSEACKIRLHTLVAPYRQCKRETNKTGNGTPGKKSPFFDKLDEVLSDKPNTLPKCVIKSTKIVKASCCELNEDHKLQGENNMNIPSTNAKNSSAAKCIAEPAWEKGEPCIILYFSLL